ncbi:MAG: uroporphyrinogen decarboxylase family protein [Bacteroidota bacterium]
MTPRENILKVLRREGMESVPVDFVLCESQIADFKKRFGHDDYESYFGMSHRPFEMEAQRNYTFAPDHFKREILPDSTVFDEYGIGHSKGSEAAFHMTRMHHPLKGADLNEILDYPYPSVADGELLKTQKTVDGFHSKGLASLAFMQMTVWEASWYLRSMEELMIDMMMEDEKATALLDKITAFAVSKATTYAKAGVDILSLGDDIGAQNSILIDVELWETWLKPRLVKVIEAAKRVNPDILIFYHSCGYVIPFIDQLIEIGVDILNPVQPECMSFDEVHDKFGDRLSFWGTLGTQELLPFGTKEEVFKTTLSRLVKSGEKGGLVIGPTHIVEPEVPWENLTSIIKGVETFQQKRK